jgi:hypothetical protein
MVESKVPVADRLEMAELSLDLNQVPVEADVRDAFWSFEIDRLLCSAGSCLS